MSERVARHRRSQRWEPSRAVGWVKCVLNKPLDLGPFRQRLFRRVHANSCSVPGVRHPSITSSIGGQVHDRRKLPVLWNCDPAAKEG